MTAAGQPRLGLLGLLLVVPIAALLLAVAPLVTYALSLVALIAFWWEDWPGTRLRASWAGWADTALIAAGAVALEAAGATREAAAVAFVAMVELTLVGEGWPLHRLPRLAGGPLAVAISWAVALAVDVPGPLLLVISAWQALFYVTWQGWPFTRIASRGRRLVCAHAAVLGAGILTYLGLHHAVGGEPLAASAACFVAAALLIGMQFEGWLDRATTLVATVVAGAGLAVTLRAVLADAWVVHVSLDALGTSIILHVAVGRRWPFGTAGRSHA